MSMFLHAKTNVRTGRQACTADITDELFLFDLVPDREVLREACEMRVMRRIAVGMANSNEIARSARAGTIFDDTPRHRPDRRSLRRGVVDTRMGPRHVQDRMTPRACEA